MGEGDSSENQIKVADIKEELPTTINTCSAIVAEKGADVTEQGPVVIKSGQPHPDTKKQAAVLKKAARDVAHELEKQLKDLKELEMQHQKNQANLHSDQIAFEKCSEKRNGSRSN